jgi:trk system potassium uptake protein TrkH
MRRFGAPQLVILSFAAAILIGAVLLQLPFCLRQGDLDFVDALFTATSAVCVTGLAVKDTGSFFSLGGQLVLLVLIQLGGLGILTVSVFFLHRMGWSVSSRYRDALASGYPSSTRMSFRELLHDTVRLTLLAESIGALGLFVRFYTQSGNFVKSLGYGVFHSVSAFCNAGFSLFQDSFETYQGDPWVNGTLMLMILTGGIGFFVLWDIKANLFSNSHRQPRPFFKRLSIQSRIVLVFSFLLVVSGAVLFFVLEQRDVLAGKPLLDKVLCSLFQSVTARTAGFNTVNIYHLTNPTLFVLVLLMFIGASPGSTGGGIKVTSFATLMMVLYNRLRGRFQTEFHHRALSTEVIQKTVTLFILSVSFISICLVLLLVFELEGIPHPESRGMFLELLFEAVSAFGTVGLSTGVTPTLHPSSKIVVILLMFVGRLGPLTLAATLERRTRDQGFRLPEEEIMIG